MIIDNTNKEEKLHKKLLPNKIELATSFLCFINSDENNGLVTYKKDGEIKPFELKENVKFKKFKLKNAMLKDLVAEIDKLAENDKKMIKKAKTAFYGEFNTSCEIKHIKNLYELRLIGDEVVFTKRIVCVCTEVENLERSFASEYPCRVVPLNEINNNENKLFEDWLIYFLNN